MIVGYDEQYEVPDNCENCPKKGSMSYQGDWCSRCPVTNCQLFEYIPGEPLTCMVPSNEYRSDWAKMYHDWFVSVGVVSGASDET